MGKIADYAQSRNLKALPNVVKVFFRYHADHNIENINVELESIIEELGNTRNRVILSSLNKYPILAVKAHTRPFDRRWMNIASVFILPVGIFLYIRMWRF